MEIFNSIRARKESAQLAFRTDQKLGSINKSHIIEAVKESKSRDPRIIALKKAIILTNPKLTGNPRRVFLESLIRDFGKIAPLFWVELDVQKRRLFRVESVKRVYQFDLFSFVNEYCS